MKYPEKIKEARRMMKQTQEQFGKRFDVSTVAVSLWENGKREAPYEVLSFCEEITQRVGEKQFEKKEGKE